MKYLTLFSFVAVVCVATAGTTHKRAPEKQENGKIVPKAVRGPGFARVYSEWNNAGFFYDFTDYVADLRLYDFDNIIRSSCQTGLWFYYEQIEYNQISGSVYWMHGIEYCGNFPPANSDITSSLRYAGSPYALNSDSFTLYQGEFFTGSEFWGDQDLYPSLDYMNNDAASFVLTGYSPWTFFTEEQYGGLALCVYPNTDHDVGQDGTTLDFGIFASIDQLSFRNSISSAAKGCFSANVLVGTQLTALHRGKNGAMGVLNMKN